MDLFISENPVKREEGAAGVSAPATATGVATTDARARCCWLRPRVTRAAGVAAAAAMTRFTPLVRDGDDSEVAEVAWVMTDETETSCLSPS